MGCHALLPQSSRPKDRTRVSYMSCVGSRVLYHTSATWEARLEKCGILILPPRPGIESALEDEVLTTEPPGRSQEPVVFNNKTPCMLLKPSLQTTGGGRTPSWVVSHPRQTRYLVPYNTEQVRDGISPLITVPSNPQAHPGTSTNTHTHTHTHARTHARMHTRMRMPSPPTPL